MDSMKQSGTPSRQETEAVGANSDSPSEVRIITLIKHLSVHLSLVISLSGLAGWLFDVERARALIANTPEVRPLASVGLLSLGVSLFLLGTKSPPRARILLARLLLAIPMILGLMAIIQYVAGIDIGIDMVLFPTQDYSRPFPGRPAAETALCLVLSSGALFILSLRSTRWIWIAQAMVVFVLALSILALTGYASGSATLYSLFFYRPLVGMAFTAASALLLLCVGIIAAHPELTIMRLLSSPTQGGVVARHLLLATVLTAPTVGLIGMLGVEAGVLTHSLRISLAPFLGSAALLILTWRAASRLDRSDRKRIAAQDELEKNESRLNAILESLPVGVWWTDEKGTILHGNPAGQRIWAGNLYVGLEELGEYKAWWLDTGEPIRPEDWALSRAVTRAEVSVEEKIEIQCFDGSRKVIFNSAMPYRDPHGRIAGAIAVNQDMSDRYRLERKQELLASAGRALLNSIDYQQTIAQVARIVVPSLADWCTIFVLDSSGSLVRAATEYRSSALPYALFDDYQPSPECRSGIYEVQRTGTPLLISRVEESYIRGITQNEGYVAVLSQLLRSCLIVPLSLKGSTIGVLSMACGESGRILEHFHLELVEELAILVALAIENANLYETTKRAVKSREDLIAVVSHDLRNPLSTVSMASSAIKLALGQAASAHSEPWADKISKSADRITAASRTMAALIQDLLDLARMEEGRFVIMKRPIDIRSLLSDVESAFSETASKQDIVLTIRYPEQPLIASLDHERVLQVIANLVGNALKFTPAHASIEVSVRSNPTEILFEVADTGSGIQPEHLPHLFDRYWLPRESATQGTGLGLFICEGIVESHGGRIWVESIAGQGARFFFTIPSRADAASAGESAGHGGSMSTG